MNPIHSKVYHYLSEYMAKHDQNNINFIIAHALIDHIHQFPDITIAQIAYIANTTPSSVTKFCHQLGYSSFKEMRNDLSPYVNQYLFEDERLYHCHDYREYMHIYYEIEKEISDELVDHINIDMIKEIAERIRRTKRVGLVVAYYNLNIMSQLSELLEKHGIVTLDVNRHNEEYLLYDAMKKCDVILVSSLTGQWISDHPKLVEKWKDRLYVISQQDLPDVKTIHLNAYARLFDSVHITQRYLNVIFMLINYYLETGEIDCPELENTFSSLTTDE